MNSKVIYKKLIKDMKFDREEFWLVGLDPLKNIVFCELLFLGTLRKCKIYPREIFRRGLVQNADQLVIAHSHPISCGIFPSNEDIKITMKLVEVGKFLDLEIADHIIIGDKKYFSFFDEGFLTLKKT